MTSSNQPRILFRADGNNQLGLGHVMRCLALAEMLGPDYHRRFAVVQPAPAVLTLVEAQGVELVRLTTDQQAEFIAVINPGEVVVLDGYSFDDNFQRAVRQRARSLVYIDDLAQGRQVADVLINHAGGLSGQDYSAEPYTELLLGTEYALLRPPFYVPATPIPAEGTLFVSLGGADPVNATIRVLEALRLCFRILNQSWRIHVVIGPLQQNRLALEAWQHKFRHLYLLTNLSAQQMVTELTKCQLAITACSTVAYEVCSVGRPLIALQTAANQERLASFFVRHHLAVVSPIGVAVDQLANAFHAGLRSDRPFTDTDPFGRLLVRNQHRFFDGRSPERFRSLFQRLCS